MRTCAYCEKELPLTKEHIWSDCLIEKYENLRTYSKRENMFYTGDPTIKDVCAHCNNVVLSKLDSYLCGLYDLLFHRILKPGEGTRIEYDYDLLLRSLLKISYNSSRANASDKIVKAHRKFAKYILHGEFRPSAALRLLVVTASRAIDLGAGTERLLEPKHLRCGEIPYDGPLGHRFAVRLVAINCFWFYIVIPYKREPPHKWSEFTSGFANWMLQPGIQMSPASSALDIDVNQTTYMHPRLLGTLLSATNV